MSHRIGFDIEANGLLDTIKTIHCICAINLDTNETYSFGPNQINEALDLLKTADVLVGHNIIGYDLPAIKKVTGFTFKARNIDTLTTARLIHSNLKDTDAALVRQGILDKELYGSNKLKAWGQRIGIRKQEYEGGFESWNPEMQEYCEQDVQVLASLWRYLQVDSYSEQAIDLENDIADVCFQMETEGWTFDKDKAIDLYAKLVERRDQLSKALISKFGTWQEVDKVLIPKRDNKTRGYVAGVPVTKMKTIAFNPNSRQHIEKKLKELGWKPQEFTESGQAKLDEDILSTIVYPEAALLIEHFTITKRLGQLADGDNGWMRMVREDGRMHGRYNTMGTVTGRAAHYSPNIGQVPACKAPYGKECRELFTVPDGWSLVGADMSGLELRCLAHYMAFFDDGAYAKAVVEGDVHTLNQKAAGLETRDQAKTFCYAVLYGGGPARIGKIINGTAKDGAKLIDRFMRNLPALARLRSDVSKASARGYLKGIDGRRIPIRSEHAALNSILQNCGSVLCKRWVIDSFKELSKKYKHGYSGDFVFCGWIHDEIQVACKNGLIEDIGRIVTECARNAGSNYGFNVRLDSEYKIGKSWADTH